MTHAELLELLERWRAEASKSDAECERDCTPAFNAFGPRDAARHRLAALSSFVPALVEALVVGARNGPNIQAYHKPYCDDNPCPGCRARQVIDQVAEAVEGLR